MREVRVVWIRVISGKGNGVNLAKVLEFDVRHGRGIDRIGK